MARKEGSMRAFICEGCGLRIVVEKENRRTWAYTWIHGVTHRRSHYCYDCDDALIQGVPFPAREDLAENCQKRQTSRASTRL
jgi:hypothetical protein